MPGRNLTRNEAGRRAQALRVHSYEIDLDVTTGPAVFRSVTRVGFSGVPGVSVKIDLVADAVHSVQLNGRSLSLDQVVQADHIDLPDLDENNVVVIVADCLYSRTGEGLHRFVDPIDDEVYLYTQFQTADASRVFACFDQPDLKARFAWTVTAPSRWTVLSNERQLTSTEILGASSRWVFAPSPPLPTYVTAIVAGPYRGFGSTTTDRDGRKLPLNVYCRASLIDHLDAEEIIETTRGGLAFYESAFDRSFPFTKYDQVFVPEFNAGAMENAGLVTISEAYVFRARVPDALRERRAITVLHELAHMWFGDLVTMAWWDDLWLNESFAEYVSHLATERTTRWTGAWATFCAREKAWAYQQDQLPTTHPVVADMADLEDVEVNFDGITYAKGASVLRQLVAWVGEDQFLRGVQAYFARHAWGNTQLTDLLTELESVSGRDLSTWSDRWLRQSGTSLLHAELVVDGSRIDQLAVLHTPPPGRTPPPMRLAVAGYDLVDGTLIRSWQTEIDVIGTRTPVQFAAGRPHPAVILINDQDLAYTKVRLDLESMRTAMAYRHTLEDPLTRALIWGMWWDACRDGEIPPSTFVSSVGQAIALESDSSQGLVMLRQLTTALTQWVAPQSRAATAAAAVSRLLDVAHDPRTNPDIRQQALKMACRHARRRDAVDHLRGIYDGRTRVMGVTVDADLRWELLTALTAAGAADEAEIADESVRDPSATGVRAASAARAAIPDPSLREQVWRQVVDEGSLTNAQQSAHIEGFTRATDPELIRPWVEPYFAALDTVWESRSSELAQGVVEGLFPLTLVGDLQVDVLAETDTWLETHPESAPALRRLVTESRDAARRALVAQAADRA